MLSSAKIQDDGGVRVLPESASAPKEDEIPSVSTTGEDDVNDNSDNENNEEMSDDEEQSYESDYEYHDEASDDDDDEGEMDVSVARHSHHPNGSASATGPSSQSLKRQRRSSSDDDDDDDEDDLKISRTMPRAPRGNLKSTGLDEDDTDQAAAFATTTTATTTTTTATSPLADPTTCGICLQEEHTPVLDCAMVAAWLELTRDTASGLLPVDPRCIQACMDRRVQECLDWLEGLPVILWPNGDCRIRDRNPLPEIFATTPDLVAVDLRRHRWNVQAWRQDYHRRAQLELERTRLLMRLEADNGINNDDDGDPQQLPLFPAVGNQRRRRRRGRGRPDFFTERRLGNLNRQIAALGMDQTMLDEQDEAAAAQAEEPQEEPPLDLQQRREQYERNTTAVREEHEAFLRSTQQQEQQQPTTTTTTQQEEPAEPPAQGFSGVQSDQDGVATT